MHKRMVAAAASCDVGQTHLHDLSDHRTDTNEHMDRNHCLPGSVWRGLTTGLTWQGLRASTVSEVCHPGTVWHTGCPEIYSGHVHVGLIIRLRG